MEGLYNRDYEIRPITLKVDILDTVGDYQFPAMKRLSIANTHGFLLVYSISDPELYTNVQRCIDEIRAQRPDFEELPIVLAGNKMDLEIERRVFKEDVTEWTSNHTYTFR